MNTQEVLGTGVCELTEDEKRTLGLKFGVKVIGPLNRLEKETNLSEGFIITSINGIPLRSIKQLIHIIKDGIGVMIGGLYPDGTHDHYFTQGLQV